MDQLLKHPILDGKFAIFTPVAALMLHTTLILLLLVSARVYGVISRKTRASYYKTYTVNKEGQGEWEFPFLISHNFENLLEMPILFYVTSIALYLVEGNTGAKVNSPSYVFSCQLGWTYFFLRVLHSIIHVTSNHVNSRMISFAGSVVVQTIMIAKLFTVLLNAGF